MTKFIFITGGVVSSLGKGICSASIAALLQSRGYNVKIRKLDPYLNVDPGTMSPTQHGEVYVTDDGAETDLDLGHYERFLGKPTSKSDNVTAGQIYNKLIGKERKGEYLGGTVQVIPHVTNLIKDFVYSDIKSEDFVICEIGGTVGDIEGLPFFEAIRQIGNEKGKDDVIFIHVTLIPYIRAAKELKTKPTQHSVKELRSIGITPRILICRSEMEVPQSERDKIALFCNLEPENVVQCLDMSSIYEVPLALHKQELDKRILEYFNISTEKDTNLNKWRKLKTQIADSKESVTIAMVGKYTGLQESYKSLTEALEHAGIASNVSINIKWVDSRKSNIVIDSLQDVDAIIVPGGFGNDGAKGKLAAIKYAREKDIPFLGICLGMQLAVIEFAENMSDIISPYAIELGEIKSGSQIIGLMRQWRNKDKLEIRGEDSDLGGSMRLGSYKCVLKEDSRIRKIYKKSIIEERHRHRYEVNVNYLEQLEKSGIVFSGMSPDGKLPEIMELPKQKFHIGVQFHPEFKSYPFKPHPLFLELISSAING